MKVLMMKTAKGCDDGKLEKTYEQGQVYELSDDLAKCFLDLGVGIVEEANVAHEKKEKMLDEPMNKALGADNYQNKAVKGKKHAN